MQEGAAIINAAVEQREAKLRGLIAKMREPLLAILAVARDVRLPVEHAEMALDSALALSEDEADSVSGDVACGLAMDSGEWQGVVRDLQTALEALTELRPEERHLLDQFFKAKGLREPDYAGEMRTLREALKVGINLIAASGGTSGFAFRQMTAAYDGTAQTNRKLSSMSDEQLLAEVRRRKLNDPLRALANMLEDVEEGPLTATGAELREQERAWRRAQPK